MEAGSRVEAECLTFRKHVGGDTLDAFAPISYYTQRVNNGQMESTWMKLSNTVTLAGGSVMERSRIKEEDFVPESAGLLTARVENPLTKRERE